jgi:ribonuclease T1
MALRPCRNLWQRLEVSGPFRYHLGFELQGKPVLVSGRFGLVSNVRQALRATLVAAVLAGAGTGPAAVARGLEPSPPTAVSLAVLPPEAQTTHRLILTGGPFPYAKDGSVFGNRERLLPRRQRGHYREYTVKTPGARDRGARRIVCGGPTATAPDACFYTDDHYASFRLIAQ